MNTSNSPGLSNDVACVIHSATLISDGLLHPNSWVALDAHGTISNMGSNGDWQALAPRDSIDAEGNFLTSGFVDIHGHGGNGADFAAIADGDFRAIDFHLEHGVTRVMASLVSAPIEQLCHQLGFFSQLDDERIIGVHLEGPFLSQAKRGVHRSNVLELPTLDSVKRLIDSGGPALRYITIAPELQGGYEAVERFVDAGVVVGLGHSEADYDQAQTAFSLGASILTHSFNAVRGIHHRSPGPVLAAVENESVSLELILDGSHVAFPVARMLAKLAPNRVALVSDAMSAAGCADGGYSLGGVAVKVTDGVATDTTGSLAGSTIALDMALRNAVERGCMSLPDAIDALTVVPARAIGVHDQFGRIAVGRVGDLVLLDADLFVKNVWLAGKLTQPGN